jgi:hypothetical protein
MDVGKALGSSLEIIKMIYETAETYRRLEKINSEFLNEIALLVSLKNQIESSKRMGSMPVIENYLGDINKKLIKIKKIIENVVEANFFKKVMHTKKLEKLSHQISKLIKKLKLVLEIKRDLDSASKLDISNIINDIEGRKFWETNFGSDNLFVQQNLFFGAVRLNTKLLANEIDFLKKVINDDNDKYISAFEFQEWIDFFGDFSVIMRRTIDSLFDPNTYEIYEWYQRNISKNVISALLLKYKFIVRKHVTQKGVFIINFKMDNIDCALYIHNKNNKFILEKVKNMNPCEMDIYNSIDKHEGINLYEIVLQLENLIDPPTNDKPRQNWEAERNKHLDVEVGGSEEHNLNTFIPKIFDDIKLPNISGFFDFFKKKV